MRRTSTRRANGHVASPAVAIERQEESAASSVRCFSTLLFDQERTSPAGRSNLGMSSLEKGIVRARNSQKRVATSSNGGQGGAAEARTARTRPIKACSRLLG